MSSFTLKVKHGDDLRRLTLASPTMAQLVSTASTLFALPSTSPLKIRYMDDDGDWITISSDQELQEAFLTVTGLPLRVEVLLAPAAAAAPMEVPASPRSTTSSFAVVEENPKVMDSEDEKEEEEQQEQDSEEDSDPESESSESSESEEEEDSEDEEEDQEVTQSGSSVTLAEATMEAPQEEEEQEAQITRSSSSSTASTVINTISTSDDIPPPSEPHPFDATGEDKDKEKELAQPEAPQAEFFDYIANEFHYHRLIIQTAVEAAFDSMRANSKPKVGEYLSKAETQRVLIIGAIERTLEEWKRDINSYPPAQEISRRVTESLQEIGTFAAPVIDNIRASLTAVLENLFLKKNPHSITSSDVLRELDTFTPRPEAVPEEPHSEETAQITQEIDSVLREQEQPEQAEQPQVTSPTDVQVKSNLADDFVYLQEEQPVVVDDFAYPGELDELLQMGFANDSTLREALTQANGNLELALEALL